MSLTLTHLGTKVKGNEFVQTIQCQFDSSYPNTGGTVGEPLTYTDLGIRDTATGASTVDFDNISTGTYAQYRFTYDRTAQTLRAWDIDTEAANGADLSSVTTLIKVTTQLPPGVQGT